MTEYDGLYGKIKHGKAVVEKALEENDNPVVGFTGGKDSTLVLWLVKQVCEEKRHDKPKMMFIDHGQHFEEMIEYVHSIAEEWGFELDIAENKFLTEFEAGEHWPVYDFPEEQIKEIEEKFEPEEIGDEYSEAEGSPVERRVFTNSLNNKVGNHMLKTYPMNQYIKENDVDAVINGIRWDEHESRSDEDFFSKREDPDHTRVHPILHITERDVWDITWGFVVSNPGWHNGYPPEGASKEDLKDYGGRFLPIAPKYFEGFRSLGSETQTEKTSEKAAWHQDLTEGTEREGRPQDKDEGDAMSELRDKGYM